MQHNLSIDTDYFQQGGCSFDDLQMAAKKLLTSSELDFNAAKKEAWYARVFDMVTFSQNKTIRIASQVQTLAQAQSILMEVLARLSSTNASAFELLSSVRVDVDRLASNDIKLAKRLRSLELKAHGLAEQHSLSQLTQIEKQVLGALLATLVPESGASPLQLRYARKTLSELGVEHAVAGDPVVLLEEVTDSKKKRQMLFCCLEYVFLQRQRLDLGELNERFKDSFDLGNRSWIELQSRVEAKFRLQGAEGFVTSEVPDDVDDNFLTSIESAVEESVVSETPERSEVSIREILHVAEGETRLFEYSDLILGSFVHCAGTLVIRHCTLEYGEQRALGRIILAKGARLEIVDSSITCWGLAESQEAFIKCDGNSVILLERCALKNCAKLIKAESAKVQIRCCEIYNPGDQFSEGGYVVGSFEMVDCTITFADLPKFQRDQLESCATVFGHARSLVQNCLFTSNGAFNEDTRVGIVGGRDSVIKSCRFVRLPKAAHNVAMVEGTSFEECWDVADLRGDANQPRHITNCAFDRCTNVITGSHVLLTASKFYDCGETLAYGSDLQFELCEFVNTRPRTRPKYGWFGPGLSIEYSGTRPEEDALIFKRCRFDGFDAGANSYLGGVWHGGSYSEDKIRLDECIFENCRTDMLDGRLFAESFTYKSLWSERRVRVVRFNSCTGLESVNKGQGESTRVRATVLGGAAVGFLTLGPVGAVTGAFAAHVLDRDQQPV